MRVFCCVEQIREVALLKRVGVQPKHLGELAQRHRNVVVRVRKLQPVRLHRLKAHDAGAAVRGLVGPHALRVQPLQHEMAVVAAQVVCNRREPLVFGLEQPLAEGVQAGERHERPVVLLLRRHHARLQAVWVQIHRHRHVHHVLLLLVVLRRLKVKHNHLVERVLLRLQLAHVTLVRHAALQLLKALGAHLAVLAVVVGLLLARPHQHAVALRAQPRQIAHVFAQMSLVASRSQRAVAVVAHQAFCRLRRLEIRVRQRAMWAAALALVRARHRHHLRASQTEPKGRVFARLAQQRQHVRHVIDVLAKHQPHAIARKRRVAGVLHLQRRALVRPAVQNQPVLRQLLHALDVADRSALPQRQHALVKGARLRGKLHAHAAVARLPAVDPLLPLLPRRVHTRFVLRFRFLLARVGVLLRQLGVQQRGVRLGQHHGLRRARLVGRHFGAHQAPQPRHEFALR